MGCKENSNLVNELTSDTHINTQKVERALRLVDRGIFVSPRQSALAYDESPFRTNNLQPGQIHISAPSIYCPVLEFLDLHKGQSFLNIGSGSGYLSTVIGYFLGENGLNHGVELYSNVVDHAQESIHIFFSKKFVVGYDWCRPEFVHGNAFSLKNISKRYDRIYVGAQVDQSHVGHFSEMLKEGGIMVIPTKFETETRFQQVKRTSEGFESEDFMHVTFAELIHPEEEGYKPETPREAGGRKRRFVDDPTNPNESVTEDLLALFNPRSLEMHATFVIRKLIGDTLRMTHPIAIMQRETSIRSSLEAMASILRRHRNENERRAHIQNMWNNEMPIPLRPAMRFLDFDNFPGGHFFRMHLPPAFTEDEPIFEPAPRVFDDAGRDVQRLEERQEATFNNEIRAAAGRGNARMGEDEDDAITVHPELMNVLQREAEDQIAYERNRRENADNVSSSSSSDDGDHDGKGAGEANHGTGDVIRMNDDGVLTMSSDSEEENETGSMNDFDAGILQPPRFLGGFDTVEEMVRRRREEAEAEGDVHFDEDGLIAHINGIIRRRENPDFLLHIDEINNDPNLRMPPNRLRFNTPGDPSSKERKRMSCLACPRASICRCYGMPSLRETAKRIITFRVSASASVRITRNTPWMRRLQRLNDVSIKAHSFADQIPGVLEEEMGPLLSNGRLAIEDWSVQRKRDKFNAQIKFLENVVCDVGRIQFKQEIGDFKKEDLSALSEYDNVGKVTFKNEEDSILRFEKELVRIVNQLPLPPNGKDVLKWNLYRN